LSQFEKGQHYPIFTNNGIKLNKKHKYKIQIETLPHHIATVTSH